MYELFLPGREDTLNLITYDSHQQDRVTNFFHSFGILIKYLQTVRPDIPNVNFFARIKYKTAVQCFKFATLNEDEQSVTIK